MTRGNVFEDQVLKQCLLSIWTILVNALSRLFFNYFLYFKEFDTKKSPTYLEKIYILPAFIIVKQQCLVFDCPKKPCLRTWCST